MASGSQSPPANDGTGSGAIIEDEHRRVFFLHGPGFTTGAFFERSDANASRSLFFIDGFLAWKAVQFLKSRICHVVPASRKVVRNRGASVG